MDDLSSIDWVSSKASALPNGSGQGSRGNYYPVLRPTPPLSGRSTPSNLHTNGNVHKPLSNVPTGSKSSTPASDSFASLVNFTGSQSTKSLSLQEQQRILQEQKTKAVDEQREQLDNHFGVGQTTFGSLQPSGTSTPHSVASPSVYPATDEHGGQTLSKLTTKPFGGISNRILPTASKLAHEDDVDLLSAFESSAPVDNSRCMPAVVDNGTADKLSDVKKEFSTKVTSHGRGTMQERVVYEEDDDPFGLGSAGPSSSAGLREKGLKQDDDDVLGLLGRPISEFSKPGPTAAVELTPLAVNSIDPLDRAVAELVDMGFSLERSRKALESTESGMNVQTAVEWLLNQAHEESRKEIQRQSSRRRDLSAEHEVKNRNRRKSSGSGGLRPAWMRDQGRAGSTQQRQDSKSPAKSEKDPAQVASELGNNLFKTANSIWKTGTKKLNQAVAEFNTDVDPSQPKWMREIHGEVPTQKPGKQQRGHEPNNHDKTVAGMVPQQTAKMPQPSVTDEALLLESMDARPQRKQAGRPKADPRTNHLDQLADLPRAIHAKHKEPGVQPNKLKTQNRDPRAKLNRQAVEEEAAQAYISPARRKKATPRPTLTESKPDLLSTTSVAPSHSPVPEPRPPKNTPAPPRPSQNNTYTRSPFPARVIPTVTPSTIQQSTFARQAGTAAFKRGDYAQATTHYTKSLSVLPPSHPLTFSILTNRALSHLKTGDPKSCLADAKTTIDCIGPSRGVGEKIELGGGEGVKPMDIYWGKAMTRQAEAYEQLERWADAAASWRTCVEAGVGGATSIAGRNRCEAAAKPKSTAPVRKIPVIPRTGRSALNDLTPITSPSTEAITRLRAANAAADKLDDEKFALADQVDARVMKWRAGKEGNLRALLSSLETVLWEDAGWKKVGMGDVLLAGKVKIVYMKGIAKVHPDKVCAYEVKLI